MPRQADGRGAAQFGAHGLIELSPQDKDGVGSGVGVKAAGVDEWFEERRGQLTIFNQVAADTLQLFRGRRRKR